MAVLFAGGELSSFTNFGAVERGLDFNAPARMSIGVAAGQWVETIPLAVAPSIFWFHADIVIPDVTANKTIVEFKNSQGATLVRIQGGGRLQHFNGASYVDLGTIPFFETPSALASFDVRIVGGPVGYVEFYLDSQFIQRFSANLSAVTDLARVRLHSTGPSVTSWSQVIIANEETIGWKLAALSATAAGAHNAWLGTYQDIEEGSTDDQFITAVVAGQKESWQVSDIVANPATAIKAVVVSARARRSSTGPTALNALVRIGSTDYERPVGAIQLGYTPTQAVFGTNPATNAAWLPTDVNAAEFGLASAD